MAVSFRLNDFDLFVNRTSQVTVDLYQRDGKTPEVLQAGDVVRFKLWDVAGQEPQLDLDNAGNLSATFTADAASDQLTSAGHGLAGGNAVQLTTTGTLPTGLATGTTYYVIRVDADTFQLSATRGGGAIDITDAGTGTHTYTHGSQVIVESLGVANTTPARVTAYVHQWDMADLTPGEFTCEFAVVDDSDGDTIKPYCRGVVNLEGSDTGNVGLT